MRLLFSDETTGSAYVMWTRAVLFYLNNIALPCLATAFTDPACFVTLILGNQQQPLIDSVHPNCLIFSSSTGECINSGLSSTFINTVPGFVYNDQCSSAVLTNYIPVFIYRLICTCRHPSAWASSTPINSTSLLSNSHHPH